MVFSTRRQVIQGAVGVALPFTGPRIGLAQGDVGSRSLGGSLHVLTAAGVNVLAHTGNGGTLLVDGGSAETSGSLLDAVGDLPSAGPVTTLFNTHWHPEQTGSNLMLGEAGATIIAQTKGKVSRMT